MNKRVLLRVDYNVSLNPNHSIADDLRIKQSLPTLNYLLERKNTVIVISHLDNPKGRDSTYSLKPVVERLQKYLPDYRITLIDDFFSHSHNNEQRTTLAQRSLGEVGNSEPSIVVLENIRFYPEEKDNDETFAKQLAALGDVYVNDAFGVSHRNDASVVSLPKFLPSYGGLLLKKEIQTISHAIENPKKPFVAIVGGVKISTKLPLLDKLIEIADYLLVGGALANTLLAAQGINIGHSLFEPDEIENAKRLFTHAKQKQTELLLPIDVVLNNSMSTDLQNIPTESMIVDIGPKTQKLYINTILKANTIIWNGPMGKFEEHAFRKGTDALYHAIAENSQAISILGGGETIAALSHEKHLEAITHISTGGGAMLEFIEKGSLPGIEALKRSSITG